MVKSLTVRQQGTRTANPRFLGQTEPGPFTRPGSVVPDSQPLPGREQTSEQYNPMGPVSL